MLFRSPHQMGRLLVHFMLLVVVAVAIEELPLHSNFESDGTISADKRYLAALAKNGRLPKHSDFNKREESSDPHVNDKDDDFPLPDEAWVDDKRHYGAFLKSHGKPNFGNGFQSRREAPSYDDQPGSEKSEKAGKRNVASLARLGRLNAARFSRFQPQHFGGDKRVNNYNEEMNDGQAREDNEVISLSADCDDEVPEDMSSNAEDNYIYPTWFQPQQKRYVAALARSGRLPVWHSQRMWWGGKRDTPYPYWLRYRSGARSADSKQNTPKYVRVLKHKNKRCKKSASSDGNSMMARKELIPLRPVNSA